MSRRLDVELTSRRDDGSWTWRAAGAKQPKGVLDGGLLPPGAAEGDLLRVDADFEVDGIFVTAVLPPKARSGRPPSERIELLGPPERRSRSEAGGGAKGNGKNERGRGRRSEGDSRGAQRKGGGKGEDKGRGKRQRRERPAGASGADDASHQGKRRHDDGGRRRDGKKRQQRDPSSAKPETTERPPRPKARKLRPGRKHRDALVASLPAEQQVVAEQVARGGLAAVRAEIEAQNRAAAEQGTPEVPSEGILRLAESLVGQVQTAEWRDRADAALAGIERVDLRDLRSVLVAAEDFARDAEARELADKIRIGLDERVERSQTEWHDELRETLADGRVVRALRLSSRPPKAGAPLPPEIAQELTAQANAALGTGNSQHRIAIVLEAVAFSPIRPYVVLPTTPAEPTEELLEAVGKVASRLPEVAAAFGIEPSPPSTRKRPRRGRGRRPQPEAASEAPADEGASGDEPTDASVDDEASEQTSSETAAADDAPVAEEASADDATDTAADHDEVEEEPGENSAAEDVAAEEVAHSS